MAREEKPAGKTYKSRYGSHAEMIDEEQPNNLPPDLVACRDADGLYLTERSNLDNGCADPYRHSGTEWRESFLKKHTL